MLEQHAARPSSLKRATLVWAGAAALVLLWTQRDRLTGHSSLSDPNVTQISPDTYVRNTDTVLVAVRNLARLESVSFHMERVIDLKQEQHHAFGMLKSQDAILLIAAGDVVAGVDLSKLQASDVIVHPEQQRVELRLPPAEVLSVSLDDKRTYVHSRHTTMLTRPGLDLETRARQQAAESIKEAALQAGILERASLTASQTLRALITSLGYEVAFVQHE
jgi:hypothetical protein